MTHTTMTEDDLLGSVLDLCRLLHLRTAHFRPARTEKGWRTAVSGDGKGFPDLVIAGPYGVLFRELKSERGSLHADQIAWRSALLTAGCNADHWRPSDWTSTRIERELRVVAGRVVA